jgi:hypothetical protein
MKRLWWSLVCVLALGVSACDGGSTQADSGPPEVDSGPEIVPAVLASVYATRTNPTTGREETYLAEQVPADFECTPSEPAGSGDSTFTVRAVDFQDEFAVEGLTVQFFPDNNPTLDGSCDAPCQEVTTDAAGEATVTDTAGSWYAYRVIAGPGTNVTSGSPSEFIGVVQLNEVAPESGGSANLNVVREGTRDNIILLLGTSSEEGTAVVTGQASDCTGRQLANATLRIFDSAGEIDAGFASSGPREFYFNGDSFPLGRQRVTNSDGLYGTANIPLPTDNTLRVELWGAKTEGGTPEMLGCESVRVGADSITIVNIGPTRADGPSDCSG